MSRKQVIRLNDSQLRQIVKQSVERVLNEADMRTLGNGKHKLKYMPKFDFMGYDKFGYDREGYDKRGFDKYGYDREGYNIRGFDRNGYDKEGFNSYGYNKDNIHRDSQKWKKILKQRQREADMENGLYISKPEKLTSSFIKKHLVPTEKEIGEPLEGILGYLEIIPDNRYGGIYAFDVTNDYNVYNGKGEIVGNLKDDVIYRTYDESGALSSIFTQFLIFKHPDSSMTLASTNNTLNGQVKKYKNRYGGGYSYYFIPSQSV